MSPVVPLIFAFIFGPVAALMAFLITFGEYSHHFSDRKKPWRLAIESAVMAFVVVGGLSWAVGYFMVRHVMGGR